MSENVLELARLETLISMIFSNFQNSFFSEISEYNISNIIFVIF